MNSITAKEISRPAVMEKLSAKFLQVHACAPNHSLDLEEDSQCHLVHLVKSELADSVVKKCAYVSECFAGKIETLPVKCIVANRG